MVEHFKNSEKIIPGEGLSPPIKLSLPFLSKKLPKIVSYIFICQKISSRTLE